MTRSWLPLGLLVVLAGVVPAAPPPPAPAPALPPLARPRPGVMARPAPARVEVAQTPAAAEPALTDDDALRAANLFPPDGPKLVAYLKQRTVSDPDRGKIADLIGRLKADGFDDRLAAAAELEKYGPAAVGPLKAAAADPDPEVAYRAGQILKRLETVPHAAVAAAAVREVVRRKPPGAAGALLGFLPLADSEHLADEIRAALVPLAAPGGTPDPALVAALSDSSPVRRGAAYVALVEGGPEKERVRIKASYDQVKAAVRADADPEAKFRGLWSLALTTREKEFVPDLIALVPSLPWGRLAQLEDLLLQVAGEHPPGGRFADTKERRAAAKDAWAGWWADKGAGVDLAKLAYKPRVRGYTDLVEVTANSFNRDGRVVTLGPDGRPRQQEVDGPIDARVFPDGRLLTVERWQDVVERDPAGRVLGDPQRVNQGQMVEPLASGGRLVVGRPMVVEFGPDGKQVWGFVRAANDVAAARRLPNGDTVVLTTGQAGPNCLRLDAKGKEVGKAVTLGRVPQQSTHYALAVAGDDKVLIGEPGQVGEYDLATGKLGWKYEIAGPTSVQRLVNGNTLIASLGGNRAVEVDPAGQVVWEYKPKDRMQVARAYRR